MKSLILYPQHGMFSAEKILSPIDDKDNDLGKRTEKTRGLNGELEMICRKGNRVYERLESISTHPVSATLRVLL